MGIGLYCGAGAEHIHFHPVAVHTTQDSVICQSIFLMSTDAIWPFLGGMEGHGGGSGLERGLERLESLGLVSLEPSKAFQERSAQDCSNPTAPSLLPRRSPAEVRWTQKCDIT